MIGPYPAREIRSIERINELDLELYARATDHFDAAIRELGPSFQEDLRVFRRRNAVYAAFAGTALQAYLSLPGTARTYLRRAIRVVRPVNIAQPRSAGTRL